LITAERLGTSLIGQVPLFPEIRESGDRGEPIVVSAPKSAAAAAFQSIAEALMSRLAIPGGPQT
jgi:ATP-binding protein involved in chromosome partitioning